MRLRVRDGNREEVSGERGVNRNYVFDAGLGVADGNAALDGAVQSLRGEEPLHVDRVLPLCLVLACENSRPDAAALAFEPGVVESKG